MIAEEDAKEGFQGRSASTNDRNIPFCNASDEDVERNPCFVRVRSFGFAEIVGTEDTSNDHP